MHDEKLFNDYEVWGDSRQEILNRIQAQMDSWGLALPAEKPIVFHFGLGEFENIGETEFWISNEIDAFPVMGIPSIYVCYNILKSIQVQWPK